MYPFDIVAGAPTPEGLDGSTCGGGPGQSKGYVGCTKAEDVPVGPHRYDFDCHAGNDYEVWLNTQKKGGTTTLQVYDTEGAAYGSSASHGNIDTVTFESTSTYGKCYALVTVAGAPNRIMLRVRSGAELKPSAAALRGHRWTAFIDAGHGKPSSPLSSPECNPDSSYNAVERQYNLRMKSATEPHVSFTDQYQLIDYDTVVLPWAENYYGQTELALRERETMLSFGCDGYRGYMMRSWLVHNQLDPTRAVALQLHNNPSGPGSFAVSGGDDTWVGAIQAAMQSSLLGPVVMPSSPPDVIEGQVDEDFWAQRSSDPSYSRGAFVRGALGLTMCGGDMLWSEADCTCAATMVSPGNACTVTIGNVAAYGPPLRGAVLLEVSKLDVPWIGNPYLTFIDPTWFVTIPGEAPAVTEGTFINRVGAALGAGIEGYLAAGAMGP